MVQLSKIPSSIKLNLRTLTVSSPKIPRNRLNGKTQSLGKIAQCGFTRVSPAKAAAGIEIPIRYLRISIRLPHISSRSSVPLCPPASLCKQGGKAIATVLIQTQTKTKIGIPTKMERKPRNGYKHTSKKIKREWAAELRYYKTPGKTPASNAP